MENQDSLVDSVKLKGKIKYPLRKRKFTNREKNKTSSLMYFIYIFVFIILISVVPLTIAQLNFFKSLLGIEVCNNNWIKYDAKGLSSDFQNKVFGQPFLVEALLPTLRSYLENDNPSKPFVASFHGSAGTGKTMVSQIIAANIFLVGTKSNFYRHYTMADAHYFSQEELINDIKTRAKECERNLFVFDEIEKMPDGTFDALKPFLDFYHKVGGIDFRKNIFIFISNNGMEKINSITKSLWDSGVKREDFRLSFFDQSLLKIAYEAEGGLKGTTIVKNYLVDLYLPFLPLEKSHVEKCIKAVQRNISSENVKNVIDELVFEPKDAPIFSLTGCKAVESTVRRYLRTHDEF